MKRLAPLLTALLVAAFAHGKTDGEGDPAPGFDSITEDDLLAHLVQLASPELEGRDSPSHGLHRAAAYLEERVRALGLESAREDGSFRMTFEREHVVPIPQQSSLESRPTEGGEALTFAYGEDFVPLGVCRGEAEGDLVFAGFGITDTKERYDDLRGIEVEGKIVLIVSGEPRHRKVLDGPDLTKHADLHLKAKNLAEAGAAGILAVRRPPAEATEGPDGEPLAPPGLSYRHTWAYWNDGKNYPPQKRELEIPVLEITEATATRLLGEDVAELTAKIDKKGKPLQLDEPGVHVYLAAAFQDGAAPMDNVVALLPGSDPSLKSEILVLGAHYDHIGVDPWGRIGYGADDNASGTAALLELAEAFVAARPRRSLLFLWFAAEEDGLIGAKRFCDDPPVARKDMIAMLNMDMLGRGDAAEIIVIGTHVNPGFEDLLKRAKKLKPTKVKKIETDKGRDLWRRSDHFAFHQIGLPVLFFTEGYPETENPDYHTYRDTVESLDIEKIARSTRFIFNTAWLCANDDERPSAPER